MSLTDYSHSRLSWSVFEISHHCFTTGNNYVYDSIFHGGDSYYQAWHAKESILGHCPAEGFLIIECHALLRMYRVSVVYVKSLTIYLMMRYCKQFSKVLSKFWLPCSTVSLSFINVSCYMTAIINKLSWFLSEIRSVKLSSTRYLIGNVTILREKIIKNYFYMYIIPDT